MSRKQFSDRVNFTLFMEIKLAGEDKLLLKGKDNELFVEAGKIKTSSIEITGPGEYEVGNVQILGVKADTGDVNYKVKIDNITVAIMFEQGSLEAFTDVHILLSVISLGDLVLKLEPKIVVVWGAEGDRLLREIGKEGVMQVAKLSVKHEKLPQELEAVWLK